MFINEWHCVIADDAFDGCINVVFIGMPTEYGGTLENTLTTMDSSLLRTKTSMEMDDEMNPRLAEIR